VIVSTKKVVDTSTQPIQVRASERRQYRTVQEKRRIVEATLQPGTSVSRVARVHGVNANQLFGWRRLYLEGRLEAKTGKVAGLLPVHVQEAVPSNSESNSTSLDSTRVVVATFRRFRSDMFCAVHAEEKHQCVQYSRRQLDHSIETGDRG
jgi:transposase